jgi:hypothetical protein
MQKHAAEGRYPDEKRCGQQYYHGIQNAVYDSQTPHTKCGLNTTPEPRCRCCCGHALQSVLQQHTAAVGMGNSTTLCGSATSLQACLHDCCIADGPIIQIQRSHTPSGKQHAVLHADKQRCRQQYCYGRTKRVTLCPRPPSPTHKARLQHHTRTAAAAAATHYRVRASATSVPAYFQGCCGDKQPAPQGRLPLRQTAPTIAPYSSAVPNSAAMTYKARRAGSHNSQDLHISAAGHHTWTAAAIPMNAASCRPLGTAREPGRFLSTCRTSYQCSGRKLPDSTSKRTMHMHKMTWHITTMSSSVFFLFSFFLFLFV